MANCPNCNGAKQTRALVNRGKAGCSWEMVNCPVCQGAGEVDDGYEERRAAGEALREARLKDYKPMAQAAAERGISVREYSDLERGRLPTEGS
jgi:DnaJ-class molecular chaperone